MTKRFPGQPTINHQDLNATAEAKAFDFHTDSSTLPGSVIGAGKFCAGDAAQLERETMEQHCEWCIGCPHCWPMAMWDGRQLVSY